MQWLDQYSNLGIPLIVLFAFAEACFGIGLFISGVILLSLCSYAYINALATLPQITILAFAGATLGDHAGFLLGRHAGPVLQQSRWAQRYKGAIEKTQTLINRWGVYAIFIGRFVPAVRSIVPFLLGMGGISRGRYSLLDVVACLLWSLALALLVLGIENLF